MTIESNVRSYCRQFPFTILSATGTKVLSNNSKTYIDFLSACGSLNYGHNHPALKAALIDYIAADGICAGLDMQTEAKAQFIETFAKNILEPRGLDFHLQFTGPTGANAVEAAIKLARKVTKRTNVIAFTNAFHGCSLGALSLTANSYNRGASRDLLTNVTRWAFDGYFGSHIDTAQQLDEILSDPSGGVDPPAAIIFEAIQGEGGLNAATPSWAQKVALVAKKHGAILIVDEIQSGCGRSGDFFAFESLGIRPDIVTLAKSISGFGLPMSIVLLAAHLDQWEPGEHNGTFRGNNHAFVTASAAIKLFWSNSSLSREVHSKATAVRKRLENLSSHFGLEVKGRGLMQGLNVGQGELSSEIRQRCFENGLIIEACGPRDEILKLLPPLVIEETDLNQGLDIIERAVAAAFSQRKAVA